MWSLLLLLTVLTDINCALKVTVNILKSQLISKPMVIFLKSLFTKDIRWARFGLQAVICLLQIEIHWYVRMIEKTWINKNYPCWIIEIWFPGITGRWTIFKILGNITCIKNVIYNLYSSYKENVKRSCLHSSMK